MKPSRSLRLFLSLGALLAASACGGDDGAPVEVLANELCAEQISCGYQLADQETCEELFLQFFDDGQIRDCHACVTSEPCESEQETCMDACTL